MGKGEQTRDQILNAGLKQASLVGLDQVSLGQLAKRLQLSKSGLFAHFGSKQQLQLALLQEAADRFTSQVIKPALAQPRGEPRVRALFENWLRWERSDAMPGGCIFITAAVEFDSRPGAIKDFVVDNQTTWSQFVAKAAELAKQEGHFCQQLDTAQFAFELQGILLACTRYLRLLGDQGWERHARNAFERLIADARSPQTP